MASIGDFRTPPEHGDVLVTPPAESWLGLARENRAVLSTSSVPLLGSTLGEWRRRTREAIVRRDDRLVFVLGHQPEFIHPGVWAKHVAASRAATAGQGIAVNLVVDSDAVRTSAISVPMVRDGELHVRSIPVMHAGAGTAYEDAGPWSAADIDEIESTLGETLGDRYADSQLPLFVDAARRSGAADWVDQITFARRAIDARFHVEIEECRVSRVWCGPLLLDMVLNAERFAGCYNDALLRYRRENRVRAPQRPIPDLRVTAGNCETAVWASRQGEPRRRLFVQRDGDGLTLLADESVIGAFPADRVRSCEALQAELLAPQGWRLRPRALALTIWARLMLADLFIHGIGGAKYDRISDAIIESYYGIRPPHRACVSATLHLGLPHQEISPEAARRLRHASRDLRYNLPRHGAAAAGLRPIVAAREQAVQRANELRQRNPGDRAARREAFERIRRLNAELWEQCGPARESAERAVAEAERRLRQSRVARSREYFFGLYDRAALTRLLDALPPESAFGL